MHNFSMAKASKPKSKIGGRGPYRRKSAQDLAQVGRGGILLRQWRMHREMTVEALAGRAQVSNGTVTGIENGTVGFTGDTLDKLAKALGTNIAFLFGINPLAGAETEILAIWEAASKEERQRIVDYSRGVVSTKGRLPYK
jgi:transcriptional regulator with XRE-family HTH domain